MFSYLKLSHSALSISASAITVVGFFSTITSPVVAQRALCPRPKLEGSTNFSRVPRNVLNAARRAAGNAQLSSRRETTAHETYEISGVPHRGAIARPVGGVNQLL
jgi:hypothetical protein